MGRRHLWTLLVVVVMLVCAQTASIRARAAAHEGAWRLVRYEGGGNIGPATGQLMLVDGRWSLIYTMTGSDGSLSGRAHGGGFSVKGNTLALDVEWSLDHVNGKGGVAAKPGTRAPTMEVAGDTLTLRYENGAVQQFQRVLTTK